MCRWLAYSGSPILMKEVLYGGTNSLVDQSLHSRLGAEPTNGDGFGVGWYGAPDTPGVFHSIEPAWNDSNLRELAGHISSPLFFTHIRAAIGSAVQQTNCHPFRHDRWLFMHNGYINELRHDQTRPRYSPSTRRCTRDQGPGRHRGAVLPRADLRPGGRPAGRRRAGDRARRRRRRAGTVCRIRSRAPSRPPTARASGRSGTRASTNRARCSTPPTFPRCASYTPTEKELQEFSDDARLIVSEPLGDVAGVWNEVPESSWGVVGPDRAELRPFQPKAPSDSVRGGVNAGPAWSHSITRVILHPHGPNRRHPQAC